MISAWKRLTSKKADEVKSPFPNGVSALEDSIQKKFSRGVQYNMKIILKGDRNTGKSCLFHRLQGKPFQEQYIPTHEIQVCFINWNSKAADGAVKVDVWDIVDKGQRKRLPSDKLKFQNDEVPDANSKDEPALDADFVDIYKGTHGVLMTFDITKPWTWSYIERELPRVPNHIPVLVLGNFRDMGEHRLVLNDTAAAFVEHLERPTGSAEVYYTESSLKNGFGLKYIHSFLNIPFLIIQRECLLRQLERNNLLIDEYRENLYPSEESEDQNYDLFMDKQLNKDQQARGSSPNEEATDERGEQSPRQQTNTPDNTMNASRTSRTTLTPSPAPVMSTRKPFQHTAQNPTQSGRGDIHNFAPGTDLEESFLGGESPERMKPHTQPVTLSDDESSDSDDGNPLVMQFQDIDSDGEDTRQRINSKGIEDSDASESEEEAPSTRETMAPHGVDDVLSNFIPSALDDNLDMTLPTSEKVVERTDTQQEDVSTTAAHDSDSDIDDSTPSYQIAQDVDIDNAEIDTDEDTSKQQTTKAPEPSSFSIDADSLELFMSDQMRKTSVTSADDKTPSSAGSSKKSSSATDPSSEKKKKKKSRKSKTGEVDGDKTERKKKSKSKDGKKKEKSGRSAKGENDYELL